MCTCMRRNLANHKISAKRKSLKEISDPAKTRTLNLQNRKLMLFPVERHGQPNNHPAWIENNAGIEKLESIRDNPEDSGKNQAKFKKISMDHHLHCMKTSIEQADALPLSINE